MDLTGLKNYLTGKGSPLELGADDVNLPQKLRDFLSTVPHKKVTLAPGEGGVNLQGSTLTVSGSSSDAWPVQGMENVSVTLSDFAFVFDASGAAPVIKGTAHGTLPLATNAHAQVTMKALHQRENPWQIKLAQNAPGLKPTDLLLLGRVGPLPFEIPPNLDVLSRVLTVPQDKFQITFYPNTNAEVFFTFQLSAPEAKWTLIDKILAFQGIDLDAFVMTNSVFVKLIGHLNVGGVGVDVGVSLGAGPDWVAFVEPSQGDAFPGLSALASWIGGNSLSGDVSSGFSSVNIGTSGFDAAIAKVSVGFKWQTIALNYLEIQSLLTVGALKLDVLLRLPEIEVSGGLHAGEAVKVKDMLASYQLPTDGVPDDLSINAVDFQARPKAGFYSVGVTVDNIWKIGPVNFEEVSALVSYDSAAGASGNFYCLLGVGATAKLNLEADYVAGSGWRFSGGTAPGTTLAIGDLISDLATKFGITSVPGPIASLTLSNLNVSYETGTGKFNFTCIGGFDVAETPVTLTVTIDVKPTQQGDAAKTDTVTGTKGYSATFGGKVAFSGLEFNLVFNTQSTGVNVFVAAYRHDEKSPPTINLHDIVAEVSKDLASAVPASLSIDLKAVKFIFLQQPQQPRQFSFGLELGASISLSDLPLVGDKLPSAETIGVKSLQIGYSNLAFTKAQADIINPLLPQGVSPIPDAGLAQGVNVAATLQLGPSTKLPLLLGGGDGQSQKPPPGTTNAPTQPVAGTTNAPTAPASSIKWFNVQKQFGVFNFKRIGVQYKENVLLFSLDAALTLGPLTFSMAGLSFGSPLTKFAPVFDLDGLGIAYVKPPLEIMGAILKVPRAELPKDVEFQFDGMVVIKTAKYSISGIASYAQMKSGDPSLFVFAQLEAALGGPPAFFITGLMAGFGFNRKLELPAQDEVADFPLLALGQPPAPGQQAEKQDPMHVLDVLEGRAPVKPGVQKAWIKPSPGDYWVAAGIQVTHFGIVTSRMLLVVEFGNEFQIALLGLATLQLPQAETGLPSYVYVQVQLMAVLRPQEGFFGLTAILSNNSFLIAPACRLTGGLAFYLWFGPNEHAGEFVVTLGGYHPAFKPPSYYPQVPRLGFNWAVSDTVTVKGDAYFALTPSCVMAGGGLEVLFHSGDLRAWFTAHADLLVSWRPFFFLAHIDVDIGVSYRLNLLFCHKTISISVGATVDLWGPPTGGRAHVHLSILSFTVGFGADETGQNNTALGWGDFKSLLPAPADVCKVSVSSGLFKSQESATSNSGKAWVVRASNFSYFTQSAIPASHLSYGGPPHASALMVNADGGSADGGNDGSAAKVLYAAADPAVDIRPMNLSGVTSTHNLSLFKNSITSKPADVSKWSLTPRHQNVPESLWGAPPEPFTQIPGRPAAKVIPQQLVGYEVQAPQPTIGHTRGVVPLSELSEEYVVPPGAAPISTGVNASPDYVPGFDDKSIGLIAALMQAQARGARDALYGALSGAQVYAGANGALDRMAATAAHIFSDPPLKQS